MSFGIEREIRQNYFLKVGNSLETLKTLFSTRDDYFNPNVYFSPDELAHFVKEFITDVTKRKVKYYSDIKYVQYRSDPPGLLSSVLPNAWTIAQVNKVHLKDWLLNKIESFRSFGVERSSLHELVLDSVRYDHSKITVKPLQLMRPKLLRDTISTGVSELTCLELRTLARGVFGKIFHSRAPKSVLKDYMCSILSTDCRLQMIGTANGGLAETLNSKLAKKTRTYHVAKSWSNKNRTGGWSLWIEYMFCVTLKYERLFNEEHKNDSLTWAANLETMSNCAFGFAMSHNECVRDESVDVLPVSEKQKLWDNFRPGRTGDSEDEIKKIWFFHKLDIVAAERRSMKLNTHTNEVNLFSKIFTDRLYLVLSTKLASFIEMWMTEDLTRTEEDMCDGPQLEVEMQSLIDESSSSSSSNMESALASVMNIVKDFANGVWKWSKRLMSSVGKILNLFYDSMKDHMLKETLFLMDSKVQPTKSLQIALFLIRRSYSTIFESACASFSSDCAREFFEVLVDGGVIDDIEKKLVLLKNEPESVDNVLKATLLFKESGADFWRTFNFKLIVKRLCNTLKKHNYWLKLLHTTCSTLGDSLNHFVSPLRSVDFSSGISDKLYSGLMDDANNFVEDCFEHVMYSVKNTFIGSKILNLFCPYRAMKSSFPLRQMYPKTWELLVLYRVSKIDILLSNNNSAEMTLDLTSEKKEIEQSWSDLNSSSGKIQEEFESINGSSSW